MKTQKINWLLLFVFGFLCVPGVHAQAASLQRQTLFMHENFETLDNWKPLDFRKIKKHSTYTIVGEGRQHYLKAHSKASASAIICKKTFDVYQFPKLRWQWKVENVYQKGDHTTKAGDDYPLRIYVIFKYDPKGLSFLDKIKYKTARLLYDKYPPHSSINYVWANKIRPEKIVTSLYSKKIKSVRLQQGKSNLGKWITESVNVLEDYQKAFGRKPPATAGLAIMNDSDDTGEESVSYISFIEISRPL